MAAGAASTLGKVPGEDLPLSRIGDLLPSALYSSLLSLNTRQEVSRFILDQTVVLSILLAGLLLIRKRETLFRGFQYTVYLLRNLSILPYTLLGWRIGIHVVQVTDIKVAQQALADSVVKGQFLEKRVATPAWAPILSIESTDGEEWETLRKNFDIFTHALPGVSELTRVMRDEVDSLLLKCRENKDKIVTSPDIVRLMAKVMWRWIFLTPIDLHSNSSRSGSEISQGGSSEPEADPAGSESDVSEGEDSEASHGHVDVDVDLGVSEEIIDLMERASWEWRKEIAVKGKGDMSIKLALIALCVKELKQSKRYRNLGLDWEKPECYSVLMQPFVVSPLINFSDIAVAMIEESNPVKAIMKQHPFPVLERAVAKDIEGTNIKAGMQVVMFHSSMAAEAFSRSQSADASGNKEDISWMTFGCGPRRCQGAHYALPMLKELSRLRDNLITSGQYRPSEGHKYSGRNNDTTLSFQEISYFLRTLVGVVFSNHSEE